MDNNFDLPLEDNPSPPKSKTVIKASLQEDGNTLGGADMQQRAAEQDTALNNESFEKNPSPPRSGSTIGNV